jgi:hypothetical protein
MKLNREETLTIKARAKWSNLCQFQIWMTKMKNKLTFQHIPKYSLKICPLLRQNNKLMVIKFLQLMEANKSME